MAIPGKEQAQFPRPSWHIPTLERLLQNLPEELAYYQGVVLLGINFKMTSDGWVCVLKGKRNREKQVAFVRALYWSDLIEMVGYMVSHGTLSWQRDRYAT